MTTEKKLEKINILFKKRVNEEFFTKNFIGLSRTLSTYLILKKSLHNKCVKHYSDFEDNFTQFYKIRFASGGFTERFYKEMQELVENKKELDIDAITMSSNLDDDTKVQFSFKLSSF